MPRAGRAGALVGCVVSGRSCPAYSFVFCGKGAFLHFLSWKDHLLIQFFVVGWFGVFCLVGLWCFGLFVCLFGVFSWQQCIILQIKTYFLKISTIAAPPRPPATD